MSVPLHVHLITLEVDLTYVQSLCIRFACVNMVHSTCTVHNTAVHGQSILKVNTRWLLVMEPKINIDHTHPKFLCSEIELRNVQISRKRLELSASLCRKLLVGGWEVCGGEGEVTTR